MSSTLRIIMKTMILILTLLVGCTTEDVAATQQNNCTSPPIVAPGLHDRTECMPASTLAQRTQQYAYNQELLLGVPIDLTLDPGCDTGECHVHTEYGYDYYAFDCTWTCMSGTCVGWCGRSHCDIVNGELWNCAPY